MRKVLIITYYWPPAGGSGVLRWLKFAKYLRDFGWEPVIYTADGGDAVEVDESLQKDVPADITVIRGKIWEPYSLYKRWVGSPKDARVKVGFLSENRKPALAERISRWVRGNLFIPDARRFWIAPSVRLLSRHLKINQVEAIVSTGPPHSTHLIARRLAKRTRLPWLADFRDPWTDIDFYKDLHLSGWADRIHHRLERNVLSSASEVVAVSPYMAERFWSKYRRRYRVITNGYDQDDLPAGTGNADSIESFTLTHAGSIGPDRNAPAFWKALGELVTEDARLAAALKVRIIGSADHSVWSCIKENGLKAFVEKVGNVPHSEIIGQMASSSLLLLFINNVPHSEGIVTGKIYEYLLARRPILCIGPVNGDAAAVIASTVTGSTFDFSDVDAIKESLRESFALHKQGKLMLSQGSDIKAYSRRELTKQLADALDLMVYVN